MSGDSSATPLPAPGYYPVPDHHHKHVVDRRWDGEVWTPETKPAAEGTTLPKHKRHFFHFLKKPGWLILLVYILASLIAGALWETDKDAKWVHGIQLLLPVFALIATAAVMTGLYVFLNRRIGFDRIAPETRKTIFKWALASAVVGFATAFGVEIGIPKLLGSDPQDGAWGLLAGPAEETGKLLLPVILWFSGRFRLPREGYLLVLATAMIFGIAEGTEYALNPEHWQPTRSVFEIMHPMFTGFIAAVAWQVAWKRESWFTWAAAGAWFIAVFAHSINDFIVLEHLDFKGSDFISLIAVVVMYLFQKHSARQLVPPDNVAEVSKHWRPAAPAHPESAAPA